MISRGWLILASLFALILMLLTLSIAALEVDANHQRAIAAKERASISKKVDGLYCLLLVSPEDRTVDKANQCKGL